MNKTVKKDLFIILVYILSSLIIEMVTFHFLGFGVSPKYIWFNVAFWIGSGMFLLIFPNIAKIIICSVILLLQITISVVNSTLYYTNGDVFYFDTIKQAEAGMQVITPDVFDIPYIIIVIMILIITVLCFILVYKLYKVSEEDKVNRKVLPLLFVMAFSCPFGVGINQIAFENLKTHSTYLSSWQGLPLDKGISESDINTTINEVGNEQFLYDNLNIGVTALRNFGTLGFYLKDFTNFLTSDSTNSHDEEILKTIEFINNGELVNSSINTSNGNNVVTILLETTAWYMIDPYLTPNLYALSNTSDNKLIDDNLEYIANNALKFMNYHARNTTNISEQLMLVGSYPYSNDAYYAINNKHSESLRFNFSLANALEQQGDVVANYFHAGDERIYFRRHTMKAFGFDNIFLLQDMARLEGYDFSNFYDFILDSDLISSFNEEMFPNDSKFYTHISTMVTHGTYLNKDKHNLEKLKPYADKLLNNWDKVAEYNTTTMPDFNFPTKDGGDFYTEYVNYKSAMMDLDKSVGILFQQLKEKGLLENTTICLFSDHYAYYNDFALQVYGYEHNDIGHSDIYHIPAFIYDVKLARKLTDNYQNLNELYNNNFCGPDNLLPTVLDVLGISYNSNHYASCSVFDDNILYYSQVASLSGFYDKNFFSFNIFDIESSTVDGRVDYNNLRQRFYCNSVYAYAKMKYLDNFYIYNREIFK